MNTESDQRRSVTFAIPGLGFLRVLLTVTVIASLGTARADENVTEQDLKHPPVAIGKFLGQHCRDCHSGDEPEAGLSLTELPFDLNKPHVFESWQRVYERVRDGEMPPDSDLGPKDTDGFLKDLDQRLMESDSRDIADRGRVRGRRLTRTEYEHTIHSLLGIDLPLRDQLPEDAASHGFETVADGQQLSYHLLSRYLDVADRALAGCV